MSLVIFSTLLWILLLIQMPVREMVPSVLWRLSRKKKTQTKCSTVCYVLSHTILFLFSTHNNPMQWVLRLRLSYLYKVTKLVRDKAMILTYITLILKPWGQGWEFNKGDSSEFSHFSLVNWRSERLSNFSERLRVGLIEGLNLEARFPASQL